MDKIERTHGYFDELIETRSREERVQFQNRALVEIVKHAYEKCQSVRNRFERVGARPEDIREVADIVKIPIFRKDELIELQRNNPPFGGLLGIPEEELSWIFMSPGPIFDPIIENDKSRDKAIASAFYSFGFRKGDKVLNTLSYHMVPAGIWNDLALRYMGCTVIPTGIGNTELQVQILKHLKVTGFSGTAGFLMNILKKAEEMGINPKKDLNLQVALAGGEAGGGTIRSLVEKEYGIITGDLYGTADVGIIAYECKEKAGMHLIENLIVEIVDPETGKCLPPGEVGEVIVTNFSKAYPLIRFGTGDLSMFDMESCPCGRTSSRLTKILGRVGDAVRVRGMFIHLKQSEQVMKSFHEISAFQLVVTRPEYRDHLKLMIELKEVSVDRKALKRSLSDKFREVCRLTPDEIIFLEPGRLAEEKKAIVDERRY
jgi:phenylacetate-CoA ligase